MSDMIVSLDGWDIGRASEAGWAPWGTTDGARAKVLASGDGYVVAMVEVRAGYVGSPHDHANVEFLYVLSGRLRTQGRVMEAGDAYAAAAGSEHTDFAAETDATYLSIFKL